MSLRKKRHASKSKAQLGHKQQGMPLSKARRLFSPLVSELSRHAKLKIPITVRGKVRAYLIAAERLEQLELTESIVARRRPPRIVGTLEIVGDLEEASRAFSKELEEAALRRARRVGFP